MKTIHGLLLCFLAFTELFCFSQTNDQTNLAAPALNWDKPPAYKEALSRLMLDEVNDYAARLNLPGPLPVTTNALTENFVSSSPLAIRFGALGSLRTTNFSFGFGKGRHLCYITRIIKGDNPYSFDDNKHFAIDPSAVNTNAAYLLATQFLAKAFVDLNRLSTSSVVSIQPWVILKMTTSKYTVQWSREGRPVAKVVLVEPKKELWTLRVEDPSLILRKPIEVANLDFLLSQTNVVESANVPSKQ